MKIIRDPEAGARKQYDLIVIGGGVYGAMFALEASLRGLSVLVLEKEDFGGATSYNSLRIIHGGLRDLQTLNLKRYWEFGRERRWFLRHFPDLVEQLPVLVPLYQRGLLRTELFRIAFWLDRVLLPRRDRNISDDRALPYGEVITPSKVRQLFPSVDERHLSGGALWYDASVPDSQRLIVEVLRCACDMGATALNYMPAVDLLTDQNRVVGVRTRDALHKTHYDFSSEVVISATGPWSRGIARRFDQDIPDLYRHSIAWNILFDREALSECALGITPPTPEGQIYFLHPWKGRLLAGTGHAPRAERQEVPRPSPEEISDFLTDLNEAIPGLELNRRDILHVFAGDLPVRQDGTTQLAKKDECVDHAEHGGPEGLFSIRSTKFTAARSTAEKILSDLFPRRTVSASSEQTFRKIREAGKANRGLFDYYWYPDAGDSGWREVLLQIIDEESVVHIDDLILRRTNLGDNPMRALDMAPILCTLFRWNEDRCREEVRRVENHFRWMEDSWESCKSQEM